MGDLPRPVCIVVSVASAGDLLQWHPHSHILVTDGAFSDDGAFHPLESWDVDAVMKLFRERLLARLIERHAISEDLARKLLAWRHPSFSAHVGEAIPFEDKKAIEDVACYVVRNPLSLKKLVYLDGGKAVLYRSKVNPSLGRNFEVMDPLEWLARMADHLPDAGKHRTHFYGFYASRVRASRRQTEASDVPAELTTKRRCPPSWARLIFERRPRLLLGRPIGAPGGVNPPRGDKESLRRGKRRCTTPTRSSVAGAGEAESHRICQRRDLGEAHPRRPASDPSSTVSGSPRGSDSQESQ